MNALAINEEVDVPPAAAEETIVATSAHSRVKRDPLDCKEGIGLDFEPQTVVDDEYGGMPTVIYDAIVRYKKEGSYPPFSDQRMDRSAHAHWRMRCTRFILSWNDDETLLYYNDRNETPRFVVKKGEVRSILQRVHEMIGHLGMKRTQYAVLRHLYWRSVRADVRKFINSCDFCTKKKNDGKKLFKASFDILGDKVDIEVALRPVEERSHYADRFLLRLIGLDEQTVKQQAQTQLVSYTFRNVTNSDRHHKIIVRSKDLPDARRKRLKRSPIRSFCSGANVTHQTSHSRRYIEMKELSHGTLEMPNGTYESMRYSDDETAPSTRFQRFAPTFPVDGVVDAFSHDEQIDDGAIICEDNTLPSTAESTHPSHCRFPIFSRRTRSKRYTQTSSADSLLHRTRAFSAYTASPSTSRLLSDSDSLLTPYDAARHRPSLTGLAPIMLIPSSDPEIVQLQKEVLRRQKSIQVLQEKVLRAQYERLRVAARKDGEESPTVSHGVEFINVDDCALHDGADFSYECIDGIIDTSNLRPQRVMIVNDKWT